MPSVLLLPVALGLGLAVLEPLLRIRVLAPLSLWVFLARKHLAFCLIVSLDSRLPNGEIVWGWFI